MTFHDGKVQKRRDVTISLKQTVQKSFVFFLPLEPANFFFSAQFAKNFSLREIYFAAETGEPRLWPPVTLSASLPTAIAAAGEECLEEEVEEDE